MFDKETLKLATEFYKNSHGKNILPMQRLELNFSDKTFIKSLVSAKELNLDNIGSIPDQHCFQLSLFKMFPKLNAENKLEIITFLLITLKS